MLQLGESALLLCAVLLSAVLWQQPAFAPLAGAALACDYGVGCLSLHGVGRPSHQFLSSPEATA